MSRIRIAISSITQYCVLQLHLCSLNQHGDHQVSNHGGSANTRFSLLRPRIIRVSTGVMLGLVEHKTCRYTPKKR